LLQLVDVDTRAGREVGLYRIAAHCLGRPECPSQRRETPPKRTERIDGLRKQLRGDFASAELAFGQQDPGEQRPGLETANRPGLFAVIQDLGSSEESNSYCHPSSTSPAARRAADFEVSSTTVCVTV